MWTWLRHQAVAMPSDQAILSELGVGDNVKDTAMVLRYKRLSRDFPNVKLGPDESIYDHFKRLENAKRGIQDRGPQSVPAFTLEGPDPDVASWITGTKGAPPVGPGRQSDLPARDPGWWTSPWSESRGYGVPRDALPQREPGGTIPNHGRPGAGYAPEPLSIQDWVQRMRDKGITLNHSLEVPNAARPGDVPPRPHGRDLMEEFSKPRVDPFGRRRASTTVTSYIERALVEVGEKLPKVASLEDEMGKLGWRYHRSGSGNWFQHDNLNGQVHILEQQPGGGYIHNYGPSEDEMVADPPIEYPSLREAFLHIHGKGGLQVPYKPRPNLPTSRMN